jgi:hypothetical protein
VGNWEGLDGKLRVDVVRESTKEERVWLRRRASFVMIAVIERDKGDVSVSKWFPTFDS